MIAAIVIAANAASRVIMRTMAAFGTLGTASWGRTPYFRAYAV
jgi:hypothetical protein